MKRNGTDDLAGNYIEVSLDSQHLWLYKDGALVTETDIVSGAPTPERETYSPSSGYTTFRSGFSARAAVT